MIFAATEESLKSWHSSDKEEEEEEGGRGKEEEEELGPEEKVELVVSRDQLGFCPRAAPSPAHTARSCSAVGGLKIDQP